MCSLELRWCRTDTYCPPSLPPNSLHAARTWEQGMCSSFGLLQVHLASIGPKVHCCTVSLALYAEAYLRLHNTSNSLLRLSKILVRWCCAFALLASRSMCTLGANLVVHPSA